MTTLTVKELFEQRDHLFTFADSGENDWSFSPVQIDEHRHIVVPPLRGGFIKADSLEFREIESVTLMNIMGDDTPQFLVLNPDDPGQPPAPASPVPGSGPPVRRAE